MKLTSKQEQGLKIATERYQLKEKFTVVSGYAGTGKSTLVKFIVANLGIDNKDVAYISYTGKAALVLKEKGCPNAMTAHKLLYKTFKKSDGTFAHVPRLDLEKDYKLIVVDEVSMLPSNMWDLLLTHKVHILAMGDPGQLPPIGTAHNILDTPHIFLDEIMRQAAESEIIRLSAEVRAGKSIKPYKGSEINIVKSTDMVDGMYTWADQIICGKNTTRRAINEYCRAMKWEEDESGLLLPKDGDKIICLHNNWDQVTEDGTVLVNGLIGECFNIKTAPGPFGWDCWLDFIPDCCNLENDENMGFSALHVDYKMITQGEPTITKENYRRFPRNYRLESFDYGYAITCHKSQGSEYNKVLVIEEVLREEQHARWLYTACTRAKEKLTLVLKN